MKGKLLTFATAALVVIAAASSAAIAQKKTETNKAVMWKDIDIAERNLYWGPGGEEYRPKLENALFLGRHPGGNSPKWRIRESSGREWIVKDADESQPEAAAVRLMWGLGYPTEINYLVPSLSMPRAGGGSFTNVRLETRPKNVKREGSWSWTDNPFVGTNEFQGLKILMAMFNNWDLKDENNVILKTDGELQYTISDLGASFGRLAKSSESRSGRSVNNPEHYAASPFLAGVEDGKLKFAYKGAAVHLFDGITVEQGRWLADRLVQLSDKQILDAFRAANYSDEDAALFAESFKARIAELDAATRSAPATQ